jgi:3-oxoacyl-[acyl-carrier-protein] synthase II
VTDDNGTGVPASDEPRRHGVRGEIDPVVITGVGAISALGTGAEELNSRWQAGEVGIEDGFGAASSFDPANWLTNKQQRRTDRFSQFAVAAADEAVGQAGWEDSLGGYDPARVACLIGSGIGGLATLEWQFGVLFDRGASALSPLAIPLLMPNAAAATVAMRLGTHGPAFATTSACAAGANAIGTASQLIRSGVVDAAIAGGSEAAMTRFSKGAFGQMSALSESGISRPFDARRDGFVLGEGAGVFVLERESSARARGATILGRLLGYASTVDAHHITAPAPDGRWAALAMTNALADAGLTPEQVDYVNAHGTSTELNDVVEAGALRTALGDRAGRIPVSSLKSAVGHLLGASGAVEAVATVLALRDGVAPPNLGYAEPDPEVALDIVVGEPRALRTRVPAAVGAAAPASNGHVASAERPLVALSNSFGFGGHNAVLALEGPDGGDAS